MKTSSLTSTKPPTAVRMPSASSASLTRLLQCAEGARGDVEVGAVGRAAEIVDQPRRGVVRILKLTARGGELGAGIVRHLARIGFGDPAVGPEPRHRGP